MEDIQGAKMDAESQLMSGMQDETVPAIDPEMERRVVRKIDRHLMPLIIGLCTSFLEL